MAVVVAGGAGFIGSRLVRSLLDRGEEVLVLDNLSRGRRSYLPGGAGGLDLAVLDLADQAAVRAALGDYHDGHPVSWVWHLAANSDIPAGISDAQIDLRNTFLSVFSVVEAMRETGIRKLAFTSSSAIYGDHGGDRALGENQGPLLPVSNYGAMKLAAEACLSAAADSFLEKLCLFRLPNVVGSPATHGVIFDFIKKLKAKPAELEVLGDGSQRKVYLHVDDLLAAMFFIVEQGPDKINLYNIGPNDAGCQVSAIAAEVVKRVSPQAAIAYGPQKRGWPGDVPRFHYCVDRLAALGWRTESSSLEAVRRAVDEIAAQEGF